MFLPQFGDRMHELQLLMPIFADLHHWRQFSQSDHPDLHLWGCKKFYLHFIVYVGRGGGLLRMGPLGLGEGEGNVERGREVEAMLPQDRAGLGNESGLAIRKATG